MSRPIALRNTTSIEQFVLVDNRRYSIGGYQVRVYEGAVAEAFLTRCAPRIVREGGVGAVEEDRQRFERVYLYNLTGDPDAPKSVKVHKFVKGTGTVEAEIDNPVAKPETVKRQLGGEERPVSINGEATTMRSAPRDVTIHPWTRKAFEKPEADWMLNREGMRPKVHQSVARSRPPTNFEPDDSWALDDMIAYARCIDPRCKVTPSEKELRVLATAGRGRKERLVELFGEVSFDSPEAVVEAAKDLMLRRIFFRVANPLYTLPTREEFLDYQTRPEASGPPALPPTVSKKTVDEQPAGGEDASFDMEAALNALPDNEGEKHASSMGGRAR